MRECLPEENDEHVFQLDKLVRLKIGLGTNILPWKALLTVKTVRSIIYSEVDESPELESPPSPTQLTAYV